MDLRRYLVAVLLVATFIAAQPADAALDNKGKEFIMAFLRAFNSPTLELHLTSDVATTVTVEYPIGTVISSVAVNPGAITIVPVPTAASMWANATVESRAVRATAADEFVCYMISRETYTSDAALALPVETFNTEYVVTTYNNRESGDAEFGVVAAFDNTTVTITPKAGLTSGQPAGVAFVVVLDKGEGYHVSGNAAGIGGDLSGSIVTADKPIGLTNGNRCTFVPPTTGYCDHVFEVAQPTQSWGKRVLMRNLPDRPSGTIYRIVASQNGTTVTRNGAPIGTINRGQFLEVGPTATDVVFESTNPIFVSQFMTGQASPGATTGDPAMGNGIPTDQFLRSYTFSAVGGGQFVLNFVTIVAASGDVGSLTLDGVAVPIASFTPIGATGFSAAIVPITSGTHSTSSTSPHGITVEGYNGYDSYLYPGGALFQFINPVGDANAPVCGELAADGYCVSGTATDNRPSEDVNGNEMLDEGEDLNDNGQIDVDAGIFFLELDGATNLTLNYGAFVPGAGSVPYTVCLTDNTIDGSGTLVVTDGAGNVCSTAVSIIANRPPEMVCLAEAATVSADAECSASVIPEQLIVSVSDPDDSGDETSWVLTMSPEGPFTVGEYEVTVTATDDHGATATCVATLVVVDDTAPTMTLASPASSWPADHTYQTFSVSDIITSVGDNCSTLSPSDAVITMVSSDEPENAAGNGDGNTIDDIVIAGDCKSVDLRSERDGNGNGRVYRVHVSLSDAAGNTTTASYVVGVPKSNNGTAAVEDAVSDAVTSSCAGGLKPMIVRGGSSMSIAIESALPNPFSDASTVTFVTSKTDGVALRLREMTGKLLATIVDGTLDAGTHTATVEAGDLPNGTYFLTLDAEGATEMYQLVLAR